MKKVVLLQLESCCKKRCVFLQQSMSISPYYKGLIIPQTPVEALVIHKKRGKNIPQELFCLILQA